MGFEARRVSPLSFVRGPFGAGGKLELAVAFVDGVELVRKGAAGAGGGAVRAARMTLLPP